MSAYLARLEDLIETSTLIRVDDHVISVLSADQCLPRRTLEVRTDLFGPACSWARHAQFLDSLILVVIAMTLYLQKVEARPY